MQLPLRDPLAYPAGHAPGFDPTHPASNFGGQGVSLVPAAGGVYINLLTGGATTKAGVQTYGVGAGGPYTQSITNGGYGSFANSFSSTVTPGFTIATIFTPASIATNGTILSTSTVAANGLQMTYRLGVMGYRNSSLFAASPVLPALTVGVPYFLALSDNGTTCYFVQVNLLTGQIVTSSVATASGLSQGSTTTWLIGGNASGSAFVNGNIHSVMAGYVALSPAQLKAWAADPWSFWYPQQDDLLFATIVGASGGSAALSARAMARYASLGAPTLAASVAAFSLAQAEAKAGPTLAASIAGRSRASAQSRGAQGTGAFFSATAAAGARAASRGAATLASLLSGRSSAVSESKAGQALGVKVAAQSSAGAKGRSASVLSLALAARARVTSVARATASLGTGLYAASGASRAIARARGVISTASSGIVINPNLILKAPATIRSLAAPMTTRLLKAVQTIRNLKAPP
jgi:hypothetical protein